MDEREEEKIFLHSLQQFWETKGVANIKIPQIGGRELEVYRLYKAVTKRGGSQVVSNNKQWKVPKEIVNEFGLPPTCTSASFTLRNHYQRLLLSYEQKFFFGKDDGKMYGDPDLPMSRKKLRTSYEEDERSQIQRTEPEQLYHQHEYTEHQLSVLLTQYYGKIDKNDSLNFIKKTKLFPTASEIKRIILAFESRLDEELNFAINNLMLYSCNMQVLYQIYNQKQSFLLEQAPQLLDNMVNYIEDSLRNMPSVWGINKFKSIPITFSQNQLISLGFEHSDNVYIEQPMLENTNIIDNNNIPVTQIMNNNDNHKKPLQILRNRNLIDLIQGTYEQKSECKILEKMRNIFVILRNLCMIRSNELSFMKNDRLKKILLQIFIHNVDSELTRQTQDIFSILCKHIQLRTLPFKEDFLKRIFEGLNSESSEETELSVEMMRSLIAIQENEPILELYIQDYLDSLAKLLIYQNQDVRESVLEFFCYLSDLKMSTRLQIAKNPFIILRIVALLASGPSKPVAERSISDKISEKNTKLAAITLNNISQAPASKQYLAHFEREIFMVASSDETVTPLLAPILYDLSLID